MNTSNDNTKWSEILHEAITKPGILMQAYSAFWNYSSGNQLLALRQLHGRDIPVGPIASFMAWKDKGRFVKKGEKAIELCMPVTCKKKDEIGEDGKPAVFTRFIYKRNWFALAQTEGAEYVPDLVPGWNRGAALAALDIREVPFSIPNGNVQGYAKGREIAINPLAQLRAKTTFHELAHIVLGHCAEASELDTEATPKNLKEVEAESVALICVESLQMEGAEYCRGYIQNWGAEIPERSAQRIFSAADKILKAGRIDADLDHDGTEDRPDYDTEVSNA